MMQSIMRRDLVKGCVATFEVCSPLRGGGSLENLDRCATRYLDWMRKNGFIPPSPRRTEG